MANIGNILQTNFETKCVFRFMPVPGMLPRAETETYEKLHALLHAAMFDETKSPKLGDLLVSEADPLAAVGQAERRPLIDNHGHKAGVRVFFEREDRKAPRGERQREIELNGEG